MTRRSRVDAVGLRPGHRPAQRQLEAELGVTIAPVAVAMANALEERPDLAVISFDKVHDAYAGTYLAVATIQATLFDRSPEGLPYLSSGVTEEDAAFLQRIAWETVQAWRAGTSAAEQPSSPASPRRPVGRVKARTAQRHAWPWPRRPDQTRYTWRFRAGVLRAYGLPRDNLM
jgi:hypothetical protein